MTSSLALGAALIGGVLLVGPLRTNGDVVTPATRPTPTAAPDYAPIPEDHASEPGLDFGTLRRVTAEGDQATIYLDRLAFYSGAEAAARNHGEMPPNDYLTEDLNGDRELAFTLDPKASVRGVLALLDPADTVDGPAGKQLPRAEFVRAATSSDFSGTLVWRRHSGGTEGPVVALAEQYTP